jgi:hypothetical protein
MKLTAKTPRTPSFSPQKTAFLATLMRAIPGAHPFGAR